ncbi:MAG: ABC transporter permease [Clostridiaceae bacterium]
MKALITSVGREFKLIFRNGISIFMVAAPAILALVFILVFGAVNETTLQLAVDETVSTQMQSQLELIADVERFEDDARMEARVRATDAVAGVTVEQGQATVIFEGNEGETFISGTSELVGLALSAPETLPAYQSVTVEAKGGLAYNLSMIGMLLMSLFIGGATVGLSIVDERESGAIRAVAVSPMRLAGFALSKLLPALMLGLAGISAAALIIGKASLLPNYLLLAAASVLVSGMMTFAIGALANNQVAAIGVLKLLVPIGMILPVSAVFVADKWQFFYYILPMYWQYRALNEILTSANALWPTLLTLLVSIPWFFAAIWYFAKKVDFRMGR